MLPIIKRELWDRKFSLLAYSVVGIALIWLYVALFPSIKASSVQLEKLFQAYPKAVFQALGVQELSFNTLQKFLGVELFSFMWPILAIVFAISRAGTTLAGEIERGTMGLYLSLPVSRLRIFIAKYTSGLISMIVFVVFTVFAILPLAAAYGESISLATIMQLSALSFLFILAVYSATMFFSALFSERSKAYMIMGGILVVSYAANVVALLKSNLNWLHWGSIFYYFNPQDVLSNNGFKLSHAGVLVGTAVIFTLAGSIIFVNRDVSN